MIYFIYLIQYFYMITGLSFTEQTQEEKPRERGCLPTWTTLPSIPDSQGLSGSFCGISNNTLILAGGSNFDRPSWEQGNKIYHDVIYVLRPGKNGLAWQAAGRLPYPVAHGASVSTSAGLLCLGGTNGQQVYSQVLLLTWDTVSQKIIITKNYPELPLPCAYLSATLLENKIYVAGGQASLISGNELHNFWQLDLLDKTAWKRLAPWPGKPLYGAILAASPTNKSILLCGGKSGSDYLCKGYLYDLQKQDGTWKNIHALPRPALLAPHIMINNHLLVFGGSDGHDIDRISELKDKYHFRKEILCYDLRKNHWSTVGALPIPVVNTNVLLWNDQLVIPGGENHPSVRTNIVQAADIPKNLDQCLDDSENILNK